MWFRLVAWTPPDWTLMKKRANRGEGHDFQATKNDVALTHGVQRLFNGGAQRQVSPRPLANQRDRPGSRHLFGPTQ
jgi:hypothetical protein